MAQDPLKQAAPRVFLAIPLHEIFRKEIEDFLRPLVRKVPGVRWVDPRQVHMTLHFFGDVPAKEIESIHLLSRKSAAFVPPFRLSLTHVGGFPSLEKPNILWLGVEETSGRLRSLQKAIQGGVRSLGFEVEARAFHPHATIGRVKGKSKEVGDLSKKALFESPTQARVVDHFVLYQSRCLPEGARYEVLEKYPLIQKDQTPA